MQIRTDSERPELSIITKPSGLIFRGCVAYYLKKHLRSILGIKRGPDAVLEGLARSLNGAGFRFNINPSARHLGQSVHVISGIEALRYAISMKERGAIRRLMAGPNIAILPTDEGELLENEQIDDILLPSEWTREAYSIASPVIRGKIRIWPVGVKVPETEDLPAGRKNVILFIKTVPEDLVSAVTKELERTGQDIVLFRYGSFKREAYLEALSKARAMVYLQEVESQGVALQEAWARDVPTLVWNKGYFTYPGTDITIHGKISSPYLSDRCGMFFKGSDDFSQKLSEFMQKLGGFQARSYCTESLSDEATADIYLSILNESKKR